MYTHYNLVEKKVFNFRAYGHMSRCRCMHIIIIYEEVEELVIITVKHKIIISCYCGANDL